MDIWRRVGGPGLAAGALALVYAVTLTTFAFWAHDGLRTQMDDLGNMVQAVWGAARGDWLMTQTNEVDAGVRSRLAVHTNLVFWAFAPLYRLWPDPRLLLVLASVACAAAGLGLHVFARHRLGPRWATLLPSLAFWASPLVHDANLYDFHVVTVVAALMVWMVWAFDSARTRLGWTLFALALSSQEHVALLTALFGLYRALGGHRRQGLAMIALSALWALALLLVVVPLVNAGQTVSKISGPDNRYRWVLERPGDVLATVLQPERLRLVLYFLLSGAVVCLRQYRFLLLLVPGLVGALLCRTFWMARVTGTYYYVVDVAVIAMACVLAASDRQQREGSGQRPLLYLAGASAVFSLLLSPLPHSFAGTWANHDRTDRATALRALMRQVPVEEPLVVQNNLGAHLAARPMISSYPRRLEQARYAVFYLRSVGGPDTGLFVRPTFSLLTGLKPRALVGAVERLMKSGEWTLLTQRDGFYLFERGPGAAAPGAEAWRTLAADRAILQRQLEAAAHHRLPWAPHLAGEMRWSRLLSLATPQRLPGQR